MALKQWLGGQLEVYIDRAKGSHCSYMACQRGTLHVGLAENSLVRLFMCYRNTYMEEFVSLDWECLIWNAWVRNCLRLFCVLEHLHIFGFVCHFDKIHSFNALPVNLEVLLKEKNLLWLYMYILSQLLKPAFSHLTSGWVVSDTPTPRFPVSE